MNVRFSQLERFAAPGAPFSSFLYEPQVCNLGDLLFLGSEAGSISYISFQGSKVSRPEEFTRSCTNNHTGPVSCMFLTFEEKLCPPKAMVPLGVLFTGGRDGSIKVWNPHYHESALLQTIVGHRGAVTGVADCKDGTFVSCSTDGTLRLWAPQKGRSFLLNPFFECIVNLSMGKDTWASTMSLNFSGAWTCFIGDSSGNIVLFRKGTPSNGVDIYSTQFSHQLSKFKTWESVHALSVVDCKILADENFIVTTSHDSTCKVLDAVLGSQVLSITNPRRVTYVGIEYEASESLLYLVDEIGFIDLVSLSKGTIVASVELLQKTSRQISNLLTSHKDRVLGSICKFSFRPNSLLLLLPYTKSVDVCRQLNSGSGLVTVWERIWDNACVVYNGHEGSVVAIAALSENVEVNSYKGVQDVGSKASSPSNGGWDGMEVRTVNNVVKPSTLRVIAEEMIFFSVGTDYTIRSWDQYENKEAFQLKRRAPSEVVCSKVLWSLNIVASGHDDGQLSLTNADSGVCVVSKSLKATISSIVEGRNNHSHILIGADYNGKVAIWNLTLFQINPTVLTTDSVRNGFHDAEEPGILSLGFHWYTRTVFSGGIDRTIRYWKLGLDASYCLRGHTEPVCCLESAHDFLVSGDESGEIILWKLDFVNNSISDIRMVCRWPASMQFCIRTIYCVNQVASDRLFILQAGLADKAIVWEVLYQPIAEDKDVSSVTAFVKRLNIDKLNIGPSGDSKSVDSKAQEEKETVQAKGGEASADEKSESEASSDRPAGVVLYPELHPNQSINVICRRVISVSGHDVTCCQMTVSKNLIPTYAYLGSSEGPILRYRL